MKEKLETNEKYYASYVVMDGEAGANPMGHASLILSRQKNPEQGIDQDIIVDNCFGYYSQPSTTTNVFIKFLKKIVKLEADLQNGHGELRQEEMRHINANGLSGISFEVSADQFNNLKQDCLTRIETEKELIKSLNEELARQGKAANGQTRFQLAKEQAKIARIEPYLKPFHIDINSNNIPFDSRASFTCKNMALDLLHKHKIISDDTKNKLLDDRNAAFPRFSSLQLRPFRLLSTGSRAAHESKNTKKIHYNHSWDKNTLYWTSPMYTLKNTAQYSTQDAQRHELLKKTLTKISTTEEKLYQIIGKKPSSKNQKKLNLDLLKHHLKEVQNTSLLFTNSAKNQNTKLLKKNVEQAQTVLNRANKAITDQNSDYSFLLKAFSSPNLMENPLLGLLLLVCAIPAFIFVPPLGASLLITGAALTSVQYYSFYKSQKQEAQTETLLHMPTPALQMT